ncbi:acyl-CoA Delta-9 desaturase [Microplitis demolitor]|uniref:acyl-CoA Delta-9 desaturase n=1 Tax=Microplitis demolitor TaxID=69319 RepID=UPI0004CCDE55|nr:acyl-CoA Delta-9 desaturase [Microplitis demolitor]
MSESKKPDAEKGDIQWHMVLWYIHLYALGLYSIWLLLFHTSWATLFFTLTIIYIGGLGVTIGAHRLWAHQSYEAVWYIKLFLMLAHTLAGVGPIYDWVLAHRIHHKYFGTEKDPFNHNEGFFYSHIISNTMTKPPNYEQTAKIIDMRDIHLDGYVWFQKKFYWPLFLIFGILLPINAPAEYWGESIANSVLVLGFLRFAVLSNMTWLIHSGILIWGLKPHEKYPPDDNMVFLITKSYWINYHYLLPWDWKCGEYGSYDKGWATTTLKIFNVIGLVNRMKTASSENIRDALFKATATKKSFQEVMNEVKEIAEVEADKMKLRYHH